jgi:transmembrane sensor
VDIQLNSAEEIIANEVFQAWYYKRNKEKANEWEQWLNAHPAYYELHAEAVTLMKAIILSESDISIEQREDAYQKLMHAIDPVPLVEMRPKQNKWWMPAAAAVLVIIAGFAFWNNRSTKAELISDYGKISEYKLPDGSEVILNANSQVTMDKTWKEGEDREVWLKGEAFFKIKKTSSGNRFVVHAQSMDIIVTGTQFNAVSYDEESSVLLTEGSVIIKTKDGKEVHMKPGDFVKIRNDISEKQTANQETILAWKQSRLDFENTPMIDVARIITRHYGVKVTIADRSIAEKKITGIMPNDNLEVLIRALEATGEYSISKTNNEIIISAAP